jgi:hypothetical protein
VLVEYSNGDGELIKPFVSDAFDNMAAYFPIDFEPPKDDKFKIS